MEIELIRCKSCGAPLYGIVCEYCGTVHKTISVDEKSDIMKAYRNGYVTKNEVRLHYGLDLARESDCTVKSYFNEQGELVHQDTIVCGEA